MSFGRIREVSSRPLMAFSSAPEYDPRQTAALQHPFVGFGFPLTLEATGSDLHRACLTRLCSVSRLFQPPDGLFLPRPSGFVSRRWRPWDSPLQRFVPLTQPARPFGPPSPPGVASGRTCTMAATAFDSVSRTENRTHPKSPRNREVCRRRQHFGIRGRPGPRRTQRTSASLTALRAHR
jgi:hypothetical protein